MRRILLILACLLPVSAGAQRNLAVMGDQRVALVIGNAAYKEGALRNPVNDARAVAEGLQRLGFVVIKRENISAKQIGPALREFRSRLSAGGVALFFYAGHGVQVRGVNYLPAVEAEIEAEEDVPTQALDVNKVLELMDEAKTRVNLVFLDACRNNPFSRKFRSVSGGLAKVDAASGTLISFATRPGSVAADGDGKNGLYTEYLLKHMETPGLPIEQLLKRVGAGVKLASKGRQEPWSEGLIEGEFFFRAGVPPAAPPIALAAPQTAALSSFVPGTSFRDCDLCPEMVVIPPGRLSMRERVVTIGQAFAVGKYEVTFEEWEACVRENGCNRTLSDLGWGRGRRPVINISWESASQYVSWLSRRTGKNYRLLSDSEWEHVARAGSTGPSGGSAPVHYDAADSHAGGLRATEKARTLPVGSRPANAYGVHDLNTNVWEWVADCRSEGDCAQRMLRGGSWHYLSRTERATGSGDDFASTSRYANYGLRVARTE